MKNSHGKGRSGKTEPAAEGPGTLGRRRGALPVPGPVAARAAGGRGTRATARLPRERKGATPKPDGRLATPVPLPQRIGSEGLKRAVTAFFLLGEEEKASYFALIVGRLPNHAGALYAGFDALDKRQKAIFVSLMANSRDVGVLLRSETGRRIIDGLFRGQADTLLSSVEAMDLSQKKELRSLLGARLPQRTFTPLAGPVLTGRRAFLGDC